MEVQLQLVKAVARQVRKCLGVAMKAECNGCVEKHPSQIQHECVKLEGEDAVRFALDHALRLVRWDMVKRDLRSSQH